MILTVRRVDLSLLLLMSAALGCGKGTGSVSGKVSFKGEPLGAGHVTFLANDGRVASAKIDNDGRYQIPSAPVGQVVVLVDSRPPPPIIVTRTPKDKGPPDLPPSGKHVPIPARYAKSGESGLAYTVRKGEQTYDIELQP